MEEENVLKSQPIEFSLAGAHPLPRLHSRQPPHTDNARTPAGMVLIPVRSEMCDHITTVHPTRLWVVAKLE
jgi:hypothetical protein